MRRLVGPVILLALALGMLTSACGSAGTATTEPSAANGFSAAAGPSAAAVVERQPQGEVITGVVVDRVVDGDTIKVTLDEGQVSVRLIGIDTPETVKPGTQVQCFGPEASAFADEQLTGQPVVLELDASQGRYDRYDRLLAYVWRVLPDGGLVLYNEEAVAGGFARERQYGDAPYAWRPTLAAAMESARDAGRGLWSVCDP